MPYLIGTDTGGTFTDCVAVDGDGGLMFSKTLTTRDDPSRGVLQGLQLLSEQIGVSFADLMADTIRLGHGSTVGTNLVVEHLGAKVLVLTTAGHGDALMLMRGGHARVVGIPREQVYSLHDTALPAPLVPRNRILEISERVDSHGDVVAPLDEDRARAAIAAALDGQDIEAVAISLLWSFKNPIHERRLAAIVRELAPEVFLSLSCEVSPRTGEYERAGATVINALVGPASTPYLSALVDGLRSQGMSAPLVAMQSNGGVTSLATAAAHPLQLIDSGPAGGLMGAATVAKVHGHLNVIGTDMGGTSFDVGLVVDGLPVVTAEQILAQHTWSLPHMDVRSIACGGGSIARYDPHARSLRVGPRSAGSSPGPACYGHGGGEPTVTDADVVLGLLRPSAFLDGRMPLDSDASHKVVGELADQLGLSPEQTAAGILRINNNAASTLIRQRTVEEGYDPRDFVLYAFGGAGPLHAFGFGPDLGVKEVVIPLGNGASTLSAFGISSSDVVEYHDLECQLRSPWSSEEFAELVATSEDQARRSLQDQGFSTQDIVLERLASMRYAEQYMQSLTVRVPSGPITAETTAEVLRRFDQEYTRLFGPAARALFQATEIFDVQTRASVRLQKPTSMTEIGSAANDGGPTDAGERSASVPESRPVFWPDAMQWLDTDVHDGTTLAVGTIVTGPAVVELLHTTVAVADGQTLTRMATGSLVLSFDKEQRTS